VTAAALVTAARSSSSPGSSGAGGTSSTQVSSGMALKTATISGASVLTNAGGFTLYRFTPSGAVVPASSLTSGGGGYGY
jgi:hypothetical protein